MPHHTEPSFSPSISSRRARGFTMVELVAVIVVVGILAAFAVPRFVQNATFDARSFTDQNLSMVRYAQKLAIAQNRQVFVLLRNNGIALCFKPACGAADRVLPPIGNNSGSKATLAACVNASNWFCEGAPNNVSYIEPTVATVFYFNALGRPFAAVDSEPMSSFSSQNIVISGGGITRTITIEAETGYVHL